MNCKQGLVADAQTLQEENLSENGLVESARRLVSGGDAAKKMLEDTPSNLASNASHD